MSDNQKKTQGRLMRAPFLADSSIVKIFVGADRKLFNVHEELLCAQLPFFKGAFKGGFKEAQSKCIDMPEDDPDVLKLLVTWVYTGDIEFASHRATEEFNDRGCWGDREYIEDALTPGEELLWCKLWVLADKVGNRELSQVVIDGFKTCLYYASRKEVSRPEVISFVYDNTAEASPLRKVIATEFTRQYFIAGGTDERKGKIMDCLSPNPKFGIDVLTEIEAHAKTSKCTFYLPDLCFDHRRDDKSSWGGQ